MQLFSGRENGSRGRSRKRYFFHVIVRNGLIVISFFGFLKKYNLFLWFFANTNDHERDQWVSSSSSFQLKKKRVITKFILFSEELLHTRETLEKSMSEIQKSAIDWKKPENAIKIVFSTKLFCDEKKLWFCQSVVNLSRETRVDSTSAVSC